MNQYLKILTHPMFQKGLVFMDQAMVSGSNFVLGILLVRWMGLEEYGVFALLWMGVLFGLGINQAFITKPLLSIAPKMENQERRNYFQGLHLVQIFVSVLFLTLGMLLFFCSSLFFEEKLAVLIPITSGIVCCQLLHDFYRKTNFVKNKIYLATLLDAILYVGQLVGVVGIIYMGKIGLVEVLSCVLAANVLSVVVGSLSIGFKFLNTNFIKDILKRHFHFSKWLLSTSILQWLSGNYFIIVGASILGTSAVGAVRMVQNIMGLCHVLFLAMENFVPIEAARQYHLEGENALLKYLTQMTWKLGLGFAVILTGLAIFSPQVLALLYGAEAVEHSYIVLAYVFLYVFVFLGHPFRFFMRTIEKTHPVFIAYVVGTIFSLFSAKPLLQNYGMNGLLFGLIATQVFAVLTYFVFVSRLSSANWVPRKNTKDISSNEKESQTQTHKI